MVQPFHGPAYSGALAHQAAFFFPLSWDWIFCVLNLAEVAKLIMSTVVGYSCDMNVDP